MVYRDTLLVTIFVATVYFVKYVYMFIDSLNKPVSVYCTECINSEHFTSFFISRFIIIIIYLLGLCAFIYRTAEEWTGNRGERGGMTCSKAPQVESNLGVTAGRVVSVCVSHPQVARRQVVCGRCSLSAAPADLHPRGRLTLDHPIG